MHSRKEFVGYSGVSEHPTYKNVQQLAQEYKRMTASRDSINCFRSRDQGNFQTAGRHAPDRCPPKSASRSEGPERSSPSKVYKQGRRAEDLYENARFYRKQAIYNWMTSSEQVTIITPDKQGSLQCPTTANKIRTFMYVSWHSLSG